MHYPGDRALSLPEWLVLCIAYEQPTYGFALAGLLSRDGRLGRIWHVSKPAIYRAVLWLERLGLVQVAGQQHTSQEPDRLLVTATRPGRTAARGWLCTPVRHGRDVQPELLLKLALHDGPGVIRETCSGNSAPSSAPWPRRWPARWKRPPASSTRWRCGGIRRYQPPCNSSTRRPSRPNWHRRPGRAIGGH